MDDNRSLFLVRLVPHLSPTFVVQSLPWLGPVYTYQPHPVNYTFVIDLILVASPTVANFSLKLVGELIRDRCNQLALRVSVFTLITADQKQADIGEQAQ